MKKSEGGSTAGQQWARALRFPVHQHGEEAQVLSPGMVPHLTVPAGTFAMPTAPTDPTAHLDLPVRTVQDITRGLPLDQSEATAFQKFVQDLHADNPHQAQSRLYEFFRDHRYEPAVRAALLERTRAFYKETSTLRDTAAIRQKRQHGAHPDGAVMAADKEALMVPKNQPVLVKADPRGGKYHARIPDGQGGHKYIYDQARYAARPDAHLRGAEILRDRARKEILDRVGLSGAGPETIGALAARYEPGIIKDAVKELIESGQVELRDGQLHRPAMAPADLEKGGPGSGVKGHVTATNVHAMMVAHAQGGGRISAKVPAVHAPHLKRALAAGLMAPHPDGGFQVTPEGHAAIQEHTSQAQRDSAGYKPPTDLEKGPHTPPPAVYKPPAMGSSAAPVHAHVDPAQTRTVAANIRHNNESAGITPRENPPQNKHAFMPEKPHQEKSMTTVRTMSDWLAKAGASLPAPPKSPLEKQQEKEQQEEAGGGDEDEDKEEGEDVEKGHKGAVHTEKWDRAVQHIKDSGKVDNPYAVATAALGKEGSILAAHRTEKAEAPKDTPVGQNQRDADEDDLPAKDLKTVGAAPNPAQSYKDSHPHDDSKEEGAGGEGLATAAAGKPSGKAPEADTTRPTMQKGGPGSGIRGHTSPTKYGAGKPIHGADTHPALGTAADLQDANPAVMRNHPFVQAHADWTPEEHAQAAKVLKETSQGKADTHLANAHAALGKEKADAYRFHGGNKEAIHPGKALSHLSKIERPEMQKSGPEGEGSRGGHIIGHTSGGKPIYAATEQGAMAAKHNANQLTNTAHEKNTPEAHRAAADAHQAAAQTYEKWGGAGAPHMQGEALKKEAGYHTRLASKHASKAKEVEHEDMLHKLHTDATEASVVAHHKPSAEAHTKAAGALRTAHAAWEKESPGQVRTQRMSDYASSAAQHEAAAKKLSGAQKSQRGTDSGTETLMKSTAMQQWMEKAGVQRDNTRSGQGQQDGIPGTDGAGEPNGRMAGDPHIPNTRSGKGGEDGLNVGGSPDAGDGKPINQDLPEAPFQLDQSTKVNGGLSEDPPESDTSPGLGEHMSSPMGTGARLEKTDPSGRTAGIPETSGGKESDAGRDERLSDDERAPAGEMPSGEPGMKGEEVNPDDEAQGHLSVTETPKKLEKGASGQLEGYGAHIRSDSEGARMFALRRMANAPRDIRILPGGPAPQQKDAEIIPFVKSINGVQYSDASDLAIEALEKAGPMVSFDVTNDLQKSVMCKGCSMPMTKALTKCPNCGTEMKAPMTKAHVLPAEKIERMAPVPHGPDIKFR